MRAEARKAAETGICWRCHQPFSDKNTHTEAGWGETRISGMCEDCFDEVCREPDDDDGGEHGQA